MSKLCKLVDAALCIFLLFVAVAVPLFDAQVCIPQHFFHPTLVQLNARYMKYWGDYLFIEEPHFFVGLVWFELIFQWPLAIACVYGIIAGKSWLHTTCLMYGSSFSTTMVAVLAELILSNRASIHLIMLNSVWFGFAILALLRGLFGQSSKNVTMTKKRA